MFGYVANIMEYNIVETTGFPYALTTSEEVRDHAGSYVVPIDFTGNVSQLHQNIFSESGYEPSNKVQQIHNDIIYLTGITEDTTAMQTTFEGDSQ